MTSWTTWSNSSRDAELFGADKPDIGPKRGLRTHQDRRLPGIARPPLRLGQAMVQDPALRLLQAARPIQRLKRPHADPLESFGRRPRAGRLDQGEPALPDLKHDHVGVYYR